MKKYKLLKDTPECNTGAIFVSKDDERLINKEKDICINIDEVNNFDKWFEEVKEYERWRADKDNVYWCVCGDGTVVDDIEGFMNCDNYRYDIGNYFKTRKEADKYSDYLIAKQVIKDSAKGFKPDWNNYKEGKWYGCYSHSGQYLIATSEYVSQKQGVIYFANQSDVEESISLYPKEWDIVMKYNG